MPFNSTVKEKAMVACARRCCLCHKFCAVNMECAHIHQESDDGSNDYDNCIPLCFDCHAASGHYNNHHPKGIKITEDELRQHRDRWYKQVEAGNVLLHSDYEELDKALFAKIYQMLGGSSRMKHFKDHDYRGNYDKAIDNRLIHFDDVSKQPETEFLTLSMESSFADLKAAIKDYLSSSVGRIWINRDGQKGIPAEWLEKGDAERIRFEDAAKVMDQKAMQVWEQYCKFIGEARRILKAETPEVIIKTL